MECPCHYPMTKDEFKKEILIGQKKSRFDVIFFVLNTLHQIQSSGYLYCYCDEKKKLKCQLCGIPTILLEFEKDTEKNMFDLDLLHFYYSKLCFKWNQLFDEDKTSADCFLHNGYEFKGRDWTSGETWSVSLLESLRYNEKIKFAQLKTKELPTPAESDETIDSTI